jgi:RNA polymerase sigma factor (TIGR02999 family)
VSTAPENATVTQILAAMDRGDPHASNRLLDLVYGELRALAQARIAREPAGLTLQPTALVHEAYLRLVDSSGEAAPFKNRAHFFAAAAEAMRRILIDRARRRSRVKHGGGRRRESLTDLGSGDAAAESLDLVALDDALGRLGALDHRLREVVMFRFFAGLSVEQTAEVMSVSPRTVKRDWEFARTWLHRELTAAKNAGTPAAAEGS